MAFGWAIERRRDGAQQGRELAQRWRDGAPRTSTTREPCGALDASRI
jgi:hypothetical protein